MHTISKCVIRMCRKYLLICMHIHNGIIWSVNVYVFIHGGKVEEFSFKSQKYRQIQLQLRRTSWLAVFLHVTFATLSPWQICKCMLPSVNEILLYLSSCTVLIPPASDETAQFTLDVFANAALKIAAQDDNMQKWWWLKKIKSVSFYCQPNRNWNHKAATAFQL